MSDLRLFTSESVTEGHPDKICDQISDSILDALLAEDRGARVAVETLVTTGLVHVAGEVTTSGYADIPAIVRKRITDIGYDSSDVWFDGRSCGVSISIGGQSPDIAQGVDTAFESRTGSSEDELDRPGDRTWRWAGRARRHAGNRSRRSRPRRYRAGATTARRSDSSVKSRAASACTAAASTASIFARASSTVRTRSWSAS